MDKKAAIEGFIKSAAKEHGQNSVILGGAARQKCDVISTGSLKIDLALGVGGIPKGRISEVHGSESGGKTTLALQATAAVQRAGGHAYYVDVEHSIDPQYATNLGVNLDSLALSQPDNGEQALDLVKSALVTKAFDIIVVDSVASLVPRAVIEGDVGDAHVGILARLMSKVLPMYARMAADANTALLFINQVRNKIGGYGNPLVTSGGEALKFYASVRIQTNRSTLNKDGDEVFGNTVKVKVIKNKLAAPFKECEPEIIYGEGFSREIDILDLGSELDIIEKSGSWYSYGGERLGQGREQVRQFLIANPTTTAAIEAKIREQYGLTSV